MTRLPHLGRRTRVRLELVLAGALMLLLSVCGESTVDFIYTGF